MRSGALDAENFPRDVETAECSFAVPRDGDGAHNAGNDLINLIGCIMFAIERRSCGEMRDTIAPDVLDKVWCYRIG
jgi:hypothetical protein